MMVLEFLIKHYDELFIYEYTKNMEDMLDNIAKGDEVWYELCDKVYNCIKELSGELKGNSRERYQIDDKHTWMIAKYGPVIKCQEGENITWKKVRKDIDFDKLKNGDYKLSDLLDVSKSGGRLLGNYKNKEMYLKKGQYGLYVEWGDNKKSLSYLEKEEIEINLQDVIYIYQNHRLLLYVKYQMI